MTRVAEAARRLGITPAALDTLLGQEQGWSADLFMHDDEVQIVLSLRELREVAARLAVAPEFLVGVEEGSVQHMSLEDLRDRLVGHLARSSEPLSAFEDRIGWRVGAFLDAPITAMDWNYDCLRDVASELGIDPRSVLAALGGRS